MAIAVPVVRMMRGPRWEAALALALVFAVVMNAQLLLPKPSCRARYAWYIWRRRLFELPARGLVALVLRGRRQPG